MNVLIRALALATLAASGGAFAQRISVTVDGNDVYFPDMQPVLRGSRVLVPLRGVFEDMGARVYWDSAAQRVTAMHDGDEVQLTIGSRYASVNGDSVYLDSPPVMINGRTMVPLRFLGEALNASVDWYSNERLVAITTNMGAPPDRNNPPRRNDPPRRTNPPRRNNPPVENDPVYRHVTVAAQTVLPLSLDRSISSRTAAVGDQFYARIDPQAVNLAGSTYLDIPANSRIEGHVSVVRPKDGNTPGVLGLAFDSLRLPDGRVVPISGSMIGLDNESVVIEDGRLVARSEKRNNDLKYIGYGAGAGAIVAILTKGNLLTNALIGAALGFLYDEIRRDPDKAKDVELAAGSNLGVRLNQELSLYLRNRS